MDESPSTPEIRIQNAAEQLGAAGMPFSYQKCGLNVVLNGRTFARIAEFNPERGLVFFENVMADESIVNGIINQALDQ